MNKETTFFRIRELGLVAVLRSPSREIALRTVDALVAGGVGGIEITFTTPDAASVVAELARAYGSEILLGVGTLTSPEQVRESCDAGAAFLVSPHCEIGLAKEMTSSGLLTMIGGLTPSEILQARSFGADIIKLFPGSLGGPDYLRALRGPFPDLPIVPTGGIELANIADWFAAGAIAVGVGGSLCPGSWVSAGRFAEISANATRFQEAINRARSPVDKVR
jgi:2-dehydro-3-deoxyphosphogluconate aldolase/(4S)-4-hydroxy-2-oxoglutarate aldolase